MSAHGIQGQQPVRLAAGLGSQPVGGRCGWQTARSAPWRRRGRRDGAHGRHRLPLSGRGRRAQPPPSWLDAVPPAAAWPRARDAARVRILAALDLVGSVARHRAGVELLPQLLPRPAEPPAPDH